MQIKMCHHVACRRAGFTLVELLAVTMVMAILAGIVLGVAGFASRKADEGKAKAELQNLQTALDGYRLENGRYPDQNIITTTQTGLAGWETLAPDLTNRVERISFTDPWGRPYQYVSQGRFAYDLYSHGPTITNTYDRIR